MSDIQEKGTYVGEDKVLTAAISEQKTPLGSEIVDVTFENGKVVKMTKKCYELITTEIPSDASIVRRTKFNAMVPSIIATIAEFDLKVSEINPLLQEVAGSIDNSFNRATNFKMTGDDTQYIPNSNPLFDRTLLEADAIIRSIPSVVEAPKPQENDGKNSTGGDTAAAA